MPNFDAVWMCDTTSAVYTNIFVGMQPRLRQVPPKTSFSTMATRRLSHSGVSKLLPDPVPMMMTSNSVAECCCIRLTLGLVFADDPHCEELAAAAIGVTECFTHAVDLMLAGNTHHLHRCLAKAQHAAGTDWVR